MLFRVAAFPRPEVKTQASEFRTVNGGNAANAAVAIAHLGARASFSGPLGAADTVGDTFLKLAARQDIDCSACPRLAGSAHVGLGDLHRRTRRAGDREFPR